MRQTVLVVDFGAQYAQLIARRVREANVYSEIVPSSMPASEMLAKEPAAIILSGGPSSVYAEGAPQVEKALFEAGVPVRQVDDPGTHPWLSAMFAYYDAHGLPVGTRVLEALLHRD